MKAIALIPARLDSKRLPGKLMMDLGGVPLINRTYENISATNLFDKVVVVTNSKIIYNSIIKSGGNAFFSKKKHRCGTDRIAEYAIKSPNDIVVNVQGDEPFVETECLKKMLELFENDTSKKIDLISIMNNLDKNDFENTNKVKVLINDKFDAIMFSRSIKTLKEIQSNLSSSSLILDYSEFKLADELIVFKITKKNVEIHKVFLIFGQLQSVDLWE